MLVGLYPEEAVTSGAAVFAWFPRLIFCLSGSPKPLPAVTETITVPPSQLIYVSFD